MRWSRIERRQHAAWRCISDDMQKPRAPRESLTTTIVFFLGQEILTNVHKSNVRSSFPIDSCCKLHADTLFMYENSSCFLCTTYIWLTLNILFNFCALCKDRRLCNFFYLFFLFRELLKRKVGVVCAKNISGEGQCTQKDNEKRWSFMLGSEVWRQNKATRKKHTREETSKWKSFTRDEIGFKLRTNIPQGVDLEVKWVAFN